MWVARFAIPLTVAATASPFHDDLFAVLQSKLQTQGQLSVSDHVLQDARLGVSALIAHFSNMSVDEQVGLVSEELADSDRKEAWVRSFEALVAMVPTDAHDIRTAIDGAQEALDGPVTRSLLDGAFEEYFGDAGMTEIRDAVNQAKSLAQLPSVQSAVAREVQDAVNVIKGIDVRGMIEGLADGNALRRAVSSAKGMFPEPLPRQAQPIAYARITDSEDQANPRDPKPKPPRTEWRGYHPNSDPDSFRYVAQPMPPSTQVLLYSVLGFVVGTQQGTLALSAFYEYLRHDQKYREICTLIVMMHQIVDTVLAYYSSRFFVLGGKKRLYPGEALIGDDVNEDGTLYQPNTNKRKIVNTSAKEFYDEYEQAAEAVATARAAMDFFNATAHIPPVLKVKAATFLELLDTVEDDMYYANPDFTIAAIEDPDVRAAFRKRYTELKEVVGSTITLANHPAAPLPGWPEHTHNASKLIIQANIAVLHLKETVANASKLLAEFCTEMVQKSFETPLVNGLKYAKHNMVLKLRPGADFARAYPIEAEKEREKQLKKMGIKRPDVPAIGLDGEDKNYTEGLSFSRTRGLKPKAGQELTEEAKDKLGSMERANLDLIQPFEANVGRVLKALESIADERGLKMATPTEDPNINVFPTAKYEHFFTKKWMVVYIGMWGLYNGYNGGLQWMAHDPGAERYLEYAREHPDVMPYYADKEYYHIKKIENSFHRYWFQALRPMIANGLLGMVIGSFFGADDISKGNVGLANS